MRYRGRTAHPLFRVLLEQASRYVVAELLYSVLLVIAAAVLSALGPVFLRFVVNGLAGVHPLKTVRLLQLIAAYVGSLWLGRSVIAIRGLVFSRAEQRIRRTLSERLFDHLMHVPIQFHLNRETGAVSQALSNGMEGLRVLLYQTMFTYLPVVFELATVTVVLLHFLTPVFLALFCSAVAGYLMVFVYSARATRNVARNASGAQVAATAAMTDSLLNYETVKYFTGEVLVKMRVSKALVRAELEWTDFYRYYAKTGLALAGIFAAFLGGTAYYAAFQVREGRMTVGDFVLINTYMLQLARPLEMMGYSMQAVSQGAAMLDKLMALFRLPTETRTGRTESQPVRGSLHFHDVSFSYDGERRVLQRVSFHLPAGRTLGIVGPSGAGKSSIVRLLTRLLEPEAGEILLGGMPISGMTLHDLRQAIAVVPQDTLLFNDTLAYNIGFGRVEAKRHEIEEAARVAQLHDFVIGLPHGYDTVVGERGVRLSGGERQRVAIARAVLKSPKIFVFDEATSSLDTRTEREILGSLLAICEANTTIMIGHRLSTVLHADEIIVLDKGRIVERGTHSSLLGENGRYTELWNTQQQGAAVA